MTERSANGGDLDVVGEVTVGRNSGIRLQLLRAAAGSRPKRKRLGCGSGSGHGQTCTRGQKGQRSRSGDGKLMGFEGGQTPLLRRIPKHGFSNGAFRKEYQVICLEDLDRMFGQQQEITLDAMRRHRLISATVPVKILGDGTLARPVKIQAHAFSKSAMEKIRKAGGTAETVAF